MHLLYLDESGSVADPNQKYFILAGVSIFERQGFWLSQKLDEIASRFNPAEPQLIELHGSPMLQGRDGWKTYPQERRLNAMCDALTVFAESHQSNRLFAAVISKSKISPKDPIEFAFEPVCSRFDQYLMRLHRQNDTQRGVMICDRTTVQNEKGLQSLISNFREVGHRWGILRNLSEVPLFLDSRASRLIQLADLIAYALSRHYERSDSRFFDIISKRFDETNGKVHGLYHLPIEINGPGS